eukprot:TRINITY_DN16566_c0_g1_i1.p1 TRINITY_DN16566_c0_g1~~TRINITY_DN16566_c0_g1_i1.p1  ORF type:complete len:457 (+),score=83.67 TRINITY_DN16566_c0_g1_i1:150-1520(+)
MGCCNPKCVTECVLADDEAVVDGDPEGKKLEEGLLVTSDNVDMKDVILEEKKKTSPKPKSGDNKQSANSSEAEEKTYLKLNCEFKDVQSESSEVSVHEKTPTHVVRWYVDLAEMDLSDELFEFLLGLICESERAGVKRYSYKDDKKRALASRLLARKACSEVLSLPYKDVQISRTKGSKPFLLTEHDTPTQPNFNFNISHDGNYAVLASEAYCLCGVDVVAPVQKRKGNGRSTLAKSFTEKEWDEINSCETEQEKDEMLQLLWSCKEAYTKARGDGLKFDLQRSEFSIVEQTDEKTILSVTVDGVAMHRWRFYSMPLDGGYRVTVARGPTADAVDAWGQFTKTLKRDITSFTPDEWVTHIEAEAPEFIKIPLGYLVPSSHHSQFVRLGGELPAPEFYPVSPIFRSPNAEVREFSSINQIPPPRNSFFGSVGYCSPRSRQLSYRPETPDSAFGDYIG